MANCPPAGLSLGASPVKRRGTCFFKLAASSVSGDIFIDPFLGSGSTLIAAQSTGRICYGTELDPLYVDISIRRFDFPVA
jgi:DNA modification methylase